MRTRLYAARWLLLFVVTAASAVPNLVPKPAPLPVKGYVLMDFHSGRILAADNPEQRMEPASITKLMSAYVVYQRLAAGRLHLDDKVPISAKAQHVEGSRMFVAAGSQVPLEDLLRGMVVQSGNDATIALAQYVAGSEAGFVQLMNAEAKRLGLARTHFSNATGLPEPDHYSSPEDIARLTRALIRDFPRYYAMYADRGYTYNKITQHNRNKLLWRDPSVDGVKTGHTSSAGYCLVASAKRGDMRLIAVVLGADKDNQRFDASENLLNYGFHYFETYQLYRAGQVLTRARVWQGTSNTLPLGFRRAVYVTIPKGRYKDMHAALRVDALIKAPVRHGDVFGSVIINLDQDPIADVPLVALKDVPTAGLLGRLSDKVLLMFASLFN